jgi:hypothetical protein
MDNDLLRKLDEYLVGETVLNDLAGSVAELARGILRSGDAQTIEVLYQLAADLVDIGEGVLSERAFFSEWSARRLHARTHDLDYRASAARTESSSNAATRYIEERSSSHVRAA